jgi:hypothetical protein
MNYINSAFLRLNVHDVVKGLSLAVIIVVVGAIQQMLTAHGLDFASYDWGGILDLAWKAAIAYLAKNFLSDSNGLVLGKI